MGSNNTVNRNLVGGGFMSTEQKKKLLWGNKKSAAPEEPGRQWDTAMFGDRDRQEKFNKLMFQSLSLRWCLWPIIGFKGRCKGGAQTRQSRCGETKGTPDGSRETIYCRASMKRWPHCWIGSLSICLRSYQTLFSDILLQFCARITIPAKLYLLAVHALGHLTFCRKNGLPREVFHLLIQVLRKCSRLLQFLHGYSVVHYIATDKYLRLAKPLLKGSWH
ncbi:hypothetical protein NC652_036100 [Populus alba x Populus x berolinensis]|nr:hypothetical protein NC652_036100 [Populus alba x Populus x berolinensis]